jgi:hypothetical protein
MSLTTKRIIGIIASSLYFALFAGCGGGGARVDSPVAEPQSPDRTSTALSTNAAQSNVIFTVNITRKSTRGRIAPRFISPSTQSLQILTDGLNPVILNLAPASPSCSPNSAAPGTYNCTVVLLIPVGYHVFTVTTYDSSRAKGNVLSTNSTGRVYVKPVPEKTRISLVLRASCNVSSSISRRLTLRLALQRGLV